MTVKLKITTGQSIVKIKSNPIGSYFVIDRPLSLIWYDCAGSLGQYFTLTHHSNSAQRNLIENIQQKLYVDYFNNENLIIDDFKDLWNLFENGHYEIDYETFTEFEDNIFLSYNESLRMTNETIFKKWKAIETNPVYINWQKQENIGHFSSCFYDNSYGGNCFLFTRAMETIDFKRVKYYEDEISNNKQPFAILLRKEFSTLEGDTLRHGNSGWFIVDGHHKLLAYQNLKISPKFLKIKQIVSEKEYFNFDINDLTEVLMTCQINHIKENLE